jgi:hypothetical protein
VYYGRGCLPQPRGCRKIPSHVEHSAENVQPTSVLPIGHSYIRPLEYMTAVSGASNLGFNEEQVTAVVRMVGAFDLLIRAAVF